MRHWINVAILSADKFFVIVFNQRVDIELQFLKDIRYRNEMYSMQMCGNSGNLG